MAGCWDSSSRGRTVVVMVSLYIQHRVTQPWPRLAAQTSEGTVLYLGPIAVQDTVYSIAPE
jgi:hypothetical protein